jgi:hypothetical protein
VTGQEVTTAVDLDLDVVRYPSGRTAIIDQDQFAYVRVGRCGSRELGHGNGHGPTSTPKP